MQEASKEALGKTPKGKKEKKTKEVIGTPRAFTRSMKNETTRELKRLPIQEGTRRYALALALTIATMEETHLFLSEETRLRSFIAQAWRENGINPDVMLTMVTSICDITDPAAIERIVTRAFTLCLTFQPCDHWEAAVDMIDNDDIPATHILTAL